jgi:Fur family ferric uptake transcriptional regulator
MGRAHPDNPSADGVIHRLLLQAKLRRTPVRAGVLDVLAHAPRPLGAVEVLEKLPPHTDAVTVYRTLNTFTGKGIVHRVRGEDRVWRYALGDSHTPAAHQHPHFVCESCGKVECLREATIPATFIASLTIAPKYTVHYPEVVLHGTCPRCA